MRKCFFCGNVNSVVLQDHHVIPKQLPGLKELDGEDHTETVCLCANCHMALHHVLRPLLKILKIIPVEEPPLIYPSKRQKIIREIINIVSYDKNNIENIIYKLSTLGYDDREEVATLISLLMRNGTIYSPKPGHYLKVD